MSNDALRELIDAERKAESWIMLDNNNYIRASDVRQLRQGAKYTTTTSENGQDYALTWPLPALVVNNELVECPYWTLKELLNEIGADVVTPPNEGRKWQRVPLHQKPLKM